ncbi:MAG: hypothetical protein ACR2L2_00790, partial [Acidobacteriota bacterium]
VTLAVGAVLLAPLCGQIFSCGCTLLQGGQHCNIHHAQPPHCPWCSSVPTGGLFPLGAALAVTALTIWAALKWIRIGFIIGIAAGISGFLFWASLAGLASALASGYPTFFGFQL